MEVRRSRVWSVVLGALASLGGASPARSAPACLAEATPTTCDASVGMLPDGVAIERVAMLDAFPLRPIPAVVDPDVGPSDVRVARAARRASPALRPSIVAEAAQLEALIRAERSGTRARAVAVHRLAEVLSELGDERGALARYRAAVDEAREYPRRDEALYRIAYLHEVEGRLDDARAAYFRLIEEAPSSSWVSYAYLAFGELYFEEGREDAGKRELARLCYERVLDRPGSGVLTAYAAYKLGFVLAAQGTYADAFRAFVTAAMHAEELGVPGAAAVTESARKHAVRLFALSGRPADAATALVPLSRVRGDDRSAAGTGEELSSLVDRAGRLLLAAGRARDARALYEAELVRVGEGTCRVRARIAHAAALEPGDDAWREAELSRQVDALAAARAAGGDEACEVATAEALTAAAVHAHRDALDGDGRAGRRALARHQLVLRAFEDTGLPARAFEGTPRGARPTMTGVAVARAQLLLARGDPAGCASAGEQAFALAGAPAERAVAVQVALVCHRERMARATIGPAAVAARVAALPTLARAVCAAGPSQHAELSLYRARALFDVRRFREAAVAYRTIALTSPRGSAGDEASRMFVHAARAVTREEPSAACFTEYEGAIAAVRAVRGARAEGDAELARAGFEARAGRASALVGTGLAGAEEAAQTYVAVARECALDRLEADRAPLCDDAPELLEGGADAYERAHLVMKSIRVRTLLLSPRYGFDRTPPARRSLFAIASAYQAISGYEEAAAFYEAFAREAPRDPRAGRALAEAASLRLSLGHEVEARRDVAAFRGAHAAADPDGAARVSLALASRQIAREDWEGARGTLLDVVPSLGARATLLVRLEARAWLGRAEQALGNRGAAGRAFARVLTQWRDEGDAWAAKLSPGDPTLRRALAAVGEARFHAAEELRARVLRARAPAARRDAAAREAEAAYAKVAELGPDAPAVWLVAADARVGEMWATLARTSGAAETTGATGPTYDRRARAAFEGCLRRSVALAHFDATSRGCEVALARTYRAEIHPLDELGITPRLPSAGAAADRAAPLDLHGAAAGLPSLPSARGGEK